MTTQPVASRSSSIVAQGRDWLRWLGIVFAVLGLAVALYMSAAELLGTETVCPGGSPNDFQAGPGAVAVDCGSVQNSAYARVFGIPVAYLGIGGYLAILAVWTLENRLDFLNQYGHLLVFGMALFGLLFSAYLTYVEFFILYAVCSWCLSSAVLMAVAFVIATVRLVQFLRAPV